MKNTTPILVLTGLAIVAAAGIAALTRDQWMGQPATPVATQEQAPAATAEKPAATPEAAPQQAEKPAEKPAEQQQATAEKPAEKPAEKQQATAEQPAKPAEQPAAEQPAAEQPVAEQPAQAAPAAQPEAQPQPNVIDEAKVPAFDTVRVEKTGEAVIAGRAEAGSEITVKFGGEDIGKTTANEDGAFVLVPEKPLPAGSGALTIEAKGKGDLNPIASEQSVAVIVPAGQQAEALVALVSPDQPTKVLQKPSAPAAEKPAEKPAETAAAVQPAAEQPAAEQPAAEQPAAQPEAEQKPAKLVSIDAVDYDATGNIVFSGQGEAGNTARVYVDNKFVGDAAVGEDGRWTFAGTAEVSKGVHTLRVDGLDAKGNVLNRVEVPFFREDQTKVAEATPPAAPAAEQPAAEQPAATQTEVKAETPPAAEKPAEQAAAQPEAPAAAAPEQPAAEQPAAQQTTAAAEVPAAEQKPAEQPAASTPPAEPAAPAQTQETAQPQETVKTTEEAVAATAPKAEAPAVAKDGRVVIQPGNNLWRISRVLYGSGTKYTLLYEANKDQIRNPNLIYPGQVFKTPDVAPRAESIDPARHEPLKPEENAAGAN